MKNQKYESEFYNAIRKYGEENFKWEIIEECNTKYELDLAEEWYIRKYRTFKDYSNCNGYNLTMGGDGNIPSKETKKKMSQNMIGKKNHQYGKKWSKEKKRRNEFKI